MKTVKLLLSLFVLISSLSGQAFAVGDDGFSSPNAAVKALLKPLTKGASGVKESITALPGEKDKNNALIQEAKEVSPERPLEAGLHSLLSKSGKLLYYRKRNEEVRLGGKMVKQYYDLYFQNGAKREAMIVILQPTLSGGYHIMDVQIDEQSAMPSGGSE